MTIQKKRYKVVANGFILNTFYAAGDVVELYPAQAKYDLPPHGAMLAELDAEAQPVAAPAQKSRKPAGE